MRKALPPLLLGLGGFFLTVALLALVWVPGQVKKTPLDIDSLTVLAGEASYLGSDRDVVKATSRNVVDGPASTGDVVVFTTFTCLMWNPDGTAPDCVSGEGDDSALINAGTDNFATDRSTALSVADQEAYVGANATPHEGLVNKFPFDVEQETYPFWDGILDRAVDAVFSGEEEIDGLATYKFVLTVDGEPAEISSGINGVYSTTKTMWVDPRTGSIIRQTEVQQREMPDGSSALDMELAFTEETVAANVEDAKANGGRLGLLGSLPWITGILGLLALAGGLVLARGAAAQEAAADPDGSGGGLTAPGENAWPGSSTTASGSGGGSWGSVGSEPTQPIRRPESGASGAGAPEV